MISLRFRPLRREDFPLLCQWLANPHVEPWWREEHTPDAVETRYGPTIDGSDPTRVFVVEGNGTGIGLIQWYRLDDNPAWRASLSVANIPPDAAGIDYLIGAEDLIGQGLGAVIVERFLEEMWSQDPTITAAVTSVDQANRRSWRVLEKAAFRRTWAGEIKSDDPSDEGLSYVYVRNRN
jgi:aminoglycoside 6'-N-acetyltransferase